ncbi:hypothetical protein FAVG1_08703 [Fusarium avenaceum]|nr:hypothetical protein FAVG1_08703 [Fusarium avenaceum]
MSTSSLTAVSDLSPSTSSQTLPFEEFRFAGQQDTANFGLAQSASFPLALTTKGASDVPTTIDLIRKLTESGDLRRLIKKHGGAILFRGLPIKTPDDYSKVAHAFGFRPHVEVGRPPLRTVLAPNVKTANEGPPELPIWTHNEYGWSTINPAWLTFCGLQIPEEGGATPITSSIFIAHQLDKLAPKFLSDLQSKGARYVYRYTVSPLVSNTGTSVRGAYGQHVRDNDDEETSRRKIETEVRRHSNRFEWHEDGSLSVTHIVPAIRIHQPTGATVFFGNLTSAWGRSRHHGATRPPFRGDDGSYHPPPEFGDGTPINPEDLDLLLNIAEDGAVGVNWEQGDLVLLDHSRKSWKGQRQVLAALWDDDGRVDDFPEGKRLLENAPRIPIIATE